MLKFVRRCVRGKTALLLGLVCFGAFAFAQLWLALVMHGAVSEHESEHTRRDEALQLSIQHTTNREARSLSDSEGDALLDLVRRQEYEAAIAWLKQKMAQSATHGETLEQHPRAQPAPVVDITPHRVVSPAPAVHRDAEISKPIQQETPTKIPPNLAPRTSTHK